MQETLRDIEIKWKQLAIGTPFDYSFLDEDYDAMYRAEERMGTVFGIFTALSIIVACLGLFGLSVYTAERRTKEIGIRKALGASVESVVTLLSKEFLQLVFIAALVAFPVAWWAMSRWLQSFAYRISLGWWIFIAAGLLAFIIAMTTISFQSIKAAMANPVKSLRTE
jgi:putative ABC transport system permease protein